MISSLVGKKIVALSLDEDELIFTFEDGKKIKILDNGQQCCEYRYMTTDDNLDYFIGSTFLGIEVLDAPNIEDGEEHEVCFLTCRTSLGVFVCENHNVHNGYYGGFSIDEVLIRENWFDKK